MKTLILSVLAIASLVLSSCAANAHAGRHSTGAGISTSGGAGVSGNIHY